MHHDIQIKPRRGFLEEAVLNLTPKNEWALLKGKEHDDFMASLMISVSVSPYLNKT